MTDYLISLVICKKSVFIKYIIDVQCLCRTKCENFIKTKQVSAKSPPDQIGPSLVLRPRPRPFQRFSLTAIGTIPKQLIFAYLGGVDASGPVVCVSKGCQSWVEDVELWRPLNLLFGATLASTQSESGAKMRSAAIGKALEISTACRALFGPDVIKKSLFLRVQHMLKILRTDMTDLEFKKSILTAVREDQLQRFHILLMQRKLLPEVYAKALKLAIANERFTIVRELLFCVSWEAGASALFQALSRRADKVVGIFLAVHAQRPKILIGALSLSARTGQDPHVIKELMNKHCVHQLTCDQIFLEAVKNGDVPLTRLLMVNGANKSKMLLELGSLQARLFRQAPVGEIIDAVPKSLNLSNNQTRATDRGTGAKAHPPAAIQLPVMRPQSATVAPLPPPQPFAAAPAPFLAPAAPPPPIQGGVCCVIL